MMGNTVSAKTRVGGLGHLDSSCLLPGMLTCWHMSDELVPESFVHGLAC